MARVGEAAFKRQLYQSMIGQLLYIKVTIEAYRSSNAWVRAIVYRTVPGHRVAS